MQHVSVVKKWGLADSAACECGEEVGTGGQHVSVASQNRRLITSSTADHYIDHHPKLASSKLGR